MFDEDGNYIPGSVDADSGYIMGMPEGIDSYYYPEDDAGGGVIGEGTPDWIQYDEYGIERDRGAGASYNDQAAIDYSSPQGRGYANGWLPENWERDFGGQFNIDYQSALDAMGDGVNLAGTAPTGVVNNASGGDSAIKRVLEALLGGKKFDVGNALMGALAMYMKTRATDKASKANEKALKGAKKRSSYYTASLSPVATSIGAAPSENWQDKLAPPMRAAKGGLAYLGGGSTGQADDVPAMLSHGEYVIDADVVAALGDGNNEAGAKKLDKMRENVRKHKRGASTKSIPPKAKRPEQYLKGA